MTLSFKTNSTVFTYKQQYCIRYRLEAYVGIATGKRTAGQGAECFMAKWIAADKARAGLRYAVVCSNVTGRTKERVAQSKRARAGSLAIVD